MLSRNFIKTHIELVESKLKLKGFDFDSQYFTDLDRKERLNRQEIEELRALRNKTSEDIAGLKKLGGDATDAILEMRAVSQRIKGLETELAEHEICIQSFLSGIPNLPDGSVPVGPDETANRIERIVGEPKNFGFEILDHVDLGSRLGILDMERASKIAGARFALSFGPGALLERALMNFMLDIHTREHGYLEVLPPFMANSHSFFGTGNLPKFEDDLFKLDDTDFYLIPTAEVPLTNIYAGEILEEEQLPMCMTAYTPCFRKEAGSYGRDTRGLIRQHQFNKVEMVKYTTPENSYDELEKLTANAEEILRRLELPYRVITLATGDMSFTSAKTYDLEAWLPSQNTYREISSCSNFEDFQARRANIRYKPKEGGKPRFVHTLNGSGLAIGRTWVAIIENYQQADGSIIIPEALRPYMDGLSVITPLK